MADTAENIIPVSLSTTINSDSINDIKGRRSQELIVGLCGAMGTFFSVWFKLTFLI